VGYKKAVASIWRAKVEGEGKRVGYKIQWRACGEQKRGVIQIYLFWGSRGRMPGFFFFQNFFKVFVSMASKDYILLFIRLPVDVLLKEIASRLDLHSLVRLSNSSKNLKKVIGSFITKKNEPLLDFVNAAMRKARPDIPFPLLNLNRMMKARYNEFWFGLGFETWLTTFSCFKRIESGCIPQHSIEEVSTFFLCMEGRDTGALLSEVTLPPSLSVYHLSAYHFFSSNTRQQALSLIETRSVHLMSEMVTFFNFFFFYNSDRSES